MFRVLPRFDFRVALVEHGDPGSREAQQDVALIAPELGLCAIADGMGGHAAGGVAAALAVQEVLECARSPAAQGAFDEYATRGDLLARRRVFDVLRDALAAANARVLREAARDPERAGMGTTLDVVWLGRDHAFIAHAGDSRVYLARATAMLQLTQDHMQSTMLAAQGEPMAAPLRPRRQPRRFDRLVNGIGLGELVSVDTVFVDLTRADRLLLCTDGVYAPIGDEAVLGQLLRWGAATDAARALVHRATLTGRDNATAIVIELGERFVARPAGERGFGAADLEHARASALFVDLPLPQLLAALAAAVEVEVPAGAPLPRAVASDLVAYVVLEGELGLPDRSLGRGATIYPESLLGVLGDHPPPVVVDRTRLLRIRADDFEEVCEADPLLGSRLYRRLAEHIARVASRGHTPGALPSVLPGPVSSGR